MQDAMNMLMLICASVAAMAFGVLAAYGICRAAFAALRLHAHSVAAANSGVRRSNKPQIARLT
jgi:membrane protein DedA with SNARE-associated domain